MDQLITSKLCRKDILMIGDNTKSCEMCPGGAMYSLSGIDLDKLLIIAASTILAIH